MPNGIVNLTFDFDALSFWVNTGQTSPAPMSRGEFGANAIERLLHLFESRGIAITFFIPGHTIDTFPVQCKAIVAAGHEVGLHGYLHEPVSALTPLQERDTFKRAYHLVGNLDGVFAEGQPHTGLGLHGAHHRHHAGTGLAVRQQPHEPRLHAIFHAPGRQC